jgi:hypothetical protein
MIAAGPAVAAAYQVCSSQVKLRISSLHMVSCHICVFLLHFSWQHDLKPKLSSCREEKTRVLSFRKKIFYLSGVVDHGTTTDCRECLVNMATCHWIRAPQLYHILSYLLSFFNLLNRFPDHWLAEPHNSSSSHTLEVLGFPTIGYVL